MDLIGAAREQRKRHENSARKLGIRWSGLTVGKTIAQSVYSMQLYTERVLAHTAEQEVWSY